MAGFRRAFRLKTASRILAWSCILAVAFLSLIPAEQMLRTGFNGRAEHVLAYAATGFVTGLAFAERGILRIILTLLAYAGGLEYLQRFSPGRISSIEDFMFSGTGVLVGVGALALLARWLPGLTEPDNQVL